jgi:hypothetical protein
MVFRVRCRTSSWMWPELRSQNSGTRNGSGAGGAHPPAPYPGRP